MSDTELPAEVSNATLASLLGVSERRIRQMLAAGLAVPAGRGRLALGPTIRRVIDDARASSATPDLLSARAELVRAKARQVELANDKADGSLVDLREVRALFQQLAGIVAGGLASLPARVAGRDLALRRRLEREADAIREAMAQAFEQERQP